jgi:hypothetical protein
MEVQFINVVDDLAQVVAALNLVLDLAKYLPDLVFDRVRLSSSIWQQSHRELARFLLK